MACGRKLSQSGTPVSHMTISRWRRSGWLDTVSAHPLDSSRAALDDSLPLLTGDARSTSAAFVKNSEEAEKLKHLSDVQLIRKAGRELAIAVIIVAGELRRHDFLITQRVQDVAFLMRSLSNCISALGKTLAHIKTMETSAAKRRASDRADAKGWEDTMEAFEAALERHRAQGR